MGQMDEFRVALFGPQAMHWTLESLSNIQSALLYDNDVDFLKQTLLDPPSLWPQLEKDFGPEHGFSGLDEFEALQGFVTGTGHLNPQSLTSTQPAPLTVMSQVLDFIHAEKHSLSSFQVGQGFCIGFLSAAALSSAKEWAEFEANVCNAVRLAACIGIVVDSREASLEAQDRAATISFRWKTAAERAYLEICLDLFPQAYVSCITDDNTVTVTLPERSQAAFREQVGEAELAISAVGIHGSYHHSN